MRTDATLADLVGTRGDVAATAYHFGWGKAAAQVVRAGAPYAIPIIAAGACLYMSRAPVKQIDWKQVVDGFEGAHFDKYQLWGAGRESVKDIPGRDPGLGGAEGFIRREVKKGHLQLVQNAHGKEPARYRATRNYGGIA